MAANAKKTLLPPKRPVLFHFIATADVPAQEADNKGYTGSYLSSDERREHARRIASHPIQMVREHANGSSVGREYIPTEDETIGEIYGACVPSDNRLLVFGRVFSDNEDSKVMYKKIENQEVRIGLSPFTKSSLLVDKEYGPVAVFGISTTHYGLTDNPEFGEELTGDPKKSSYLHQVTITEEGMFKEFRETHLRDGIYVPPAVCNSSGIEDIDKARLDSEFLDHVKNFRSAYQAKYGEDAPADRYDPDLNIRIASDTTAKEEAVDELEEGEIQEEKEEDAEEGEIQESPPPIQTEDKMDIDIPESNTYLDFERRERSLLYDSPAEENLFSNSVTPDPTVEISQSASLSPATDVTTTPVLSVSSATFHMENASTIPSPGSLDANHPPFRKPDEASSMVARSSIPLNTNNDNMDLGNPSPPPSLAESDAMDIDEGIDDTNTSSPPPSSPESTGLTVDKVNSDLVSLQKEISDIMSGKKNLKNVNDAHAVFGSLEQEKNQVREWMAKNGVERFHLSREASVALDDVERNLFNFKQEMKKANPDQSIPVDSYLKGPDNAEKPDNRYITMKLTASNTMMSMQLSRKSLEDSVNQNKAHMDQNKKSSPPPVSSPTPKAPMFNRSSAFSDSSSSSSSSSPSSLKRHRDDEFGGNKSQAAPQKNMFTDASDNNFRSTQRRAIDRTGMYHSDLVTASSATPSTPSHNGDINDVTIADIMNEFGTYLNENTHNTAQTTYFDLHTASSRLEHKSIAPVPTPNARAHLSPEHKEMMMSIGQSLSKVISDGNYNSVMHLLDESKVVGIDKFGNQSMMSY